MTNLNHYLEAFKKLSEEDQNNILNDLLQVKKKLEEQQGSQVGAIFKNLNERPAWKNLEAKCEAITSILAEQKKNDSTTVDPEIIGSQDALDEVNNELQEREDGAIEKKSLGPSLHTLTDAHPKIKEAIESGEIKKYVKQSDGSYTLGDQKLSEKDAHKLMGKESLYAITEECPYWRGEPQKTTTIFARKNIEGVDGIQRAFELQGITQENYTDSKLLTEEGLKPLFEKYNNKKYEYLFNQPDWLNLDSNAKQQLQQLVMEINTPKTGCQYSGGGRGCFATDSYFWLPRYFNGGRVYLWSDQSVADFDYGGVSAALPVGCFAV